MKHAVSNIKPVAKQKLKKINKNVVPKKVESKKKTILVNTALKSPKKSFAAKPKSVRAKVKAIATAKLKTQKDNSKNSVKAARVEVGKTKSSSPAKTNKNVLRGTIKVAAKKTKKTKQIVSNGKSVQKKSPSKLVKPARIIKGKATKVSVKSARIKMSKSVAPKIKISASAKKAAPVKKQNQPKILIKKVEKAKPLKTVALVKVLKTPKIKPLTVAKKIRTISKKEKNIAVAAKAKPKTKKIGTIVSAKKTKTASGKTKTILPLKTGKTKTLKTEISGRKAEIKSAKGKRIAPAVEDNTKSKAAQLVYSATTGKIIETKSAVSASGAKLKARKIKLSNAARNINIAENKIETGNLQSLENVRKKKTKPIGTAVFRGKKERYDFKVFSIKEEIENVPAIYVISRRKTDKQNRGHHALVCIGQTDSISDEIKKHQKSKCVKKNDANVISILPEENEKKRMKIETDLRAAHAIACYLK